MTDTTQAVELPATALPAGMATADYTASLTAAPAPAAGARPDNIPEKFWDADKGAVNVEALLKSQADLEKQFKTNPPAKVEGAPEAAAEAAADAAIDEAPITIERKAEEPAPEAKPLTTAVETFAARYAETKGQLADEDFAPLLEQGLPREVIDIYLAGIKAQEALQQQAVHALAGGEDRWKAAEEWASRSASDDDLATFNSIGNPKAQVEWLMAKYDAANPSEGSFVEGEASSSPGDVFRSVAEQSAAINDPRYLTDTAYRADVQAKMGRSMKAGFIVNHRKM